MWKLREFAKLSKAYMLPVPIESTVNSSYLIITVISVKLSPSPVVAFCSVFIHLSFLEVINLVNDEIPFLPIVVLDYVIFQEISSMT